MGLCSLTCFRKNLVFLFLFRGSQTKKLAESAPMCTAWPSHVVGCFFQRQMTDFVVGWWHLIIFQKIQSIQIRQEQPTTMWGIRRIWMRISPLNSPQHSGSASWPAFSSLAPSFDRRPPQRMQLSFFSLFLVWSRVFSIFVELLVQKSIWAAWVEKSLSACAASKLTFGFHTFNLASLTHSIMPWKYNKTGLNFELVPQLWFVKQGPGRTCKDWVWYGLSLE